MHIHPLRPQMGSQKVGEKGRRGNKREGNVSRCCAPTCATKGCDSCLVMMATQGKWRTRTLFHSRSCPRSKFLAAASFNRFNMLFFYLYVLKFPFKVTISSPEIKVKHRWLLFLISQSMEAWIIPQYHKNVWVTLAHALQQDHLCLSTDKAEDPQSTCLVGIPFKPNEFPKSLMKVQRKTNQEKAPFNLQNHLQRRLHLQAPAPSC